MVMCPDLRAKTYLCNMLLYNVTIGIDQNVEQEWVAWMKEVHIPAVMETGYFVRHQFYKILHDNEDGTSSYSIQYFAESISQVEQYLELKAPSLIKAHQDRFKDQHVAFRTLLDEI